MRADLSAPAVEAPPLVLVVDDNDAGRFARQQNLTRAGYRVVAVATGRDAIERCAAIQPDVVLLDVNLPDMSGLAVCEAIKGQSGVPTVQVLHISATATGDGDRARGLLTGADAYLIEPVGPEVLLATVAALVRVRRTELALAEAVSNERTARREAERANRFKDEFLATLSHELRTPLSAVAGWVWQLRQGILDEPARQRAIDGLERATKMQLRMINDLLDVSRIGRGRLELDLARVDLAAVVAMAVESVHAMAAARQLAITVSTTPVLMLGDEARLHQIVANLLANAIKFNVQHGRIDVSLTADDREAVIRVRDTGMGIDADLLPYVFDRFRQGDGGFSRRHSGLGLGLTIVRELVALHGGSVTAESDGPGAGATFTVRLPVSGAGEPDAVPKAPAIGEPLAGVRVLVVDDDDESRAWLVKLVEFGGGEAVGDASADAALDRLAGDRFDLIVSDIAMPGRDGANFLRELRARGDETAMVAVTAFAAADQRRRILSAGFADYFMKPVDPPAFLRRLAELHESHA